MEEMKVQGVTICGCDIFVRTDDFNKEELSFAADILEEDLKRHSRDHVMQTSSEYRKMAEETLGLV